MAGLLFLSSCSALHVVLACTLYFGLILESATVAVPGQRFPRNDASPTRPETHRDRNSSFGVETDVVAIARDRQGAANETALDARAEVLLLVPPAGKKGPPLQSGDHFSASSMVMDYGEDTRKFLITEEIGSRNSMHHRRRHHLSRDHPKELPSDQPASGAVTPSRKRWRVRVPMKALLHGEKEAEVFGKDGGRHDVSGGATFRHPIGNDSWVALHSPVKIYIPVTYKDENSILSSSSFKDCVQCPFNLTLTMERGKDYAKVPVPAISICSRLARRPGSMNVAVTSGPRPGAKVPEGEYPIELIVWKPGGHVYSCRYALTVKGTNGLIIGKESKGLSCSRPRSPTNGTVVCNWNGDGPYPADSVCQYFCYPGFQISGPESGEAISVCSDGKWNFSSVSCSAKYCSQIKVPEHGNVKCHYPEPGDGPASDSKHPNGTLCHFRCRRGYVVPTSQLPLHAMVCQAPEWNVTSIPGCKRAVFPKHPADGCRNRTFMVAAGGVVDMALHPPPPWVAGGRKLKPTCTLAGRQLPRGAHPNFCEATDPELRVTATCKYFIHVRERGPVHPHPRDCRNQTRLTARGGVAHVKVPRFLARLDGESTKVSVPGTCTYSGDLPAGFYINHCAAIDPETNSTAHCTYSITVKARFCPPLLEVPHATVQCGDNAGTSESYPADATCTYECDDGFVVPQSQRKRMAKRCHPKMSWRPAALPTCVEGTPPTPRPKDCKNQILRLRNGKTLKKIKPPRFKSSYKDSRVKVNCTLGGYFPAGNYTNFCHARDVELQITVTCKYHIVIQAAGCPLSLLPTSKHSTVQCSSDAKQYDQPIGSSCHYECDPGFVIPTRHLLLSTTICEEGSWNSTVAPECIAMIAPVPKEDSCLNDSMTVDNLSTFYVKSPEFLSYLGSTLVSNCTPTEISSYGVHDVICTAFEPEIRIPSSCEFQLEIRGPEDEAELKKAVDCEPPEPPSNGFTDCLVVERGDAGYRCRVFCQPKHEFPSQFKILRNGTVECDRTDGLWDFQRIYNVTGLAECLEVLPTTGMRVWLSFSAAVESCADEQFGIFRTAVNQSLLSLNQEMCGFVDCESSILINCSWDAGRNRFLLRVNWTIQAEYDPAEFEGTDMVPPVETQIETILETTQRAITTEEHMRKEWLKVGMELLQDSYRRGHFRLACLKRGYMVDPRTDQCMACPRESMEVDGFCQTCPKREHQPKSGQATCKPCPESVEDLEGNYFPSTC